MSGYRIIDRHDFGMFGNYAFAGDGKCEMVPPACLKDRACYAVGARVIGQGESEVSRLARDMAGKCTWRWS